MAKLTSLLFLDDLGSGLKGTDSRLLLLATSTEEFLVVESSTIGMLFFAEEELFLVVDAVDAVAGDLLEPLVDEGATADVFLDFPTSGDGERNIGGIKQWMITDTVITTLTLGNLVLLWLFLLFCVAVD